MVRPRSVICWHCTGFRQLWLRKSKPGRPPIGIELQRLIKRLADDNPLWGEERIANELLLKLDIAGRRAPSESTCLSARPAHRAANSGGQRYSITTPKPSLPAISW